MTNLDVWAENNALDMRPWQIAASNAIRFDAIRGYTYGTLQSWGLFIRRVGKGNEAK